MDKAPQLYGDIEVVVAKENPIGCKFHAEYGFYFMGEIFHEPTEQQMLRLKFTASKSKKQN